MAGSFNKVFLMGNLTRDVEVRHTSGNSAVANLGLAVNRKFHVKISQKLLFVFHFDSHCIDP